MNSNTHLKFKDHTFWFYSPLLRRYSTSYNTPSFEYSSYEWDSTRKKKALSPIFQNNKTPWLSLVLNWIIKMDNFCRANFLQKPKETMNRLHDENWRRSQGGRKCLQCFIALRLCLVSISSVFAGFKERNGWYSAWGLHFPLHFECTVKECRKIQIPEHLDLFYSM